VTRGCFVSDREGEAFTLDQYWQWLKSL